jgi:hypothetical protein
LSGPLPVFDCLLDQPRLSTVLREQLRLGLRRLRELLLQNPGDATVQLLPLHFEQTLVSGVPHQRVLEGVAGLTGRAARKDQLGGGKPVQGSLQLTLGGGRDRREERVGELAPDAGRDLRHLFGRGEPVQAGHERVSECGRDRELRRRARELVAIASILEQA